MTEEKENAFVHPKLSQDRDVYGVEVFIGCPGHNDTIKNMRVDYLVRFMFMYEL